MLNPLHLLTLRAVVETGSVTAAAARLEYSPSAVSQQMSALEKDVGTPLFERSGRGIRATAAAHVLADHAAAVLGALTDAEAAVADVREGRAGAVRVLTFQSAGDSLLPRTVARLRRTMPGVEVRVDVGEGPEAFEALRSGALDVLVSIEATGAGDPPVDDLAWTHLLDDRFRLLMPKDHPMARRRVIEVTDLADEAWVTPVSTPYCGDVNVFELCQRAGFDPQIVSRTGDYSAVQGYVAAGMGVALVPDLALGAVREGVVVRRLSPAPRPRHVWAATRPALLHQRSVAAVVSALRTVAAEEQSGRAA